MKESDVTISSIMAKSKILIVEDDPDILELLHFNLEKEGYQTFRTENGEQAVLLAQKHTPDLILLDLLLPGMDGLEVCRRLKRDPALQHIPIIMVTAKGEEMDRVVGLELGADDYIVKPFSIRELILRIHKLLDRREKQGPPSFLKADSLILDLEAHTAKLDDNLAGFDGHRISSAGPFDAHPGKGSDPGNPSG